MMVRSSTRLAPGNPHTIRALALLTLAIAACSPAAGPAQSAAAETATAALAPSPSIAATPVPLSFGVESEAVSTGTVTLEAGGTITATGSDGTTFELVVPPEAVAGDTQITMTPLREVAGIQTNAIHAVQLEPEGQLFHQLARLTITPGEAIPIADQLIVEAAGDGSDPGPALVDPTIEAIVVLLEHFTVGAAASVTPEQRALFLEKSASNAETRLARELAEAIQQEKRRQLVGGGEDLEALDEVERRIVDEYDSEVVEKRRQAAMLSCAALKTYVSTAFGAERARQLLLGLGSEAATIAANERIVAALQAMTARYQDCEKESIAACKAAKDPKILIEFWLSMAKQFGQSVGDGAAMKRRAEQICDPQGFALRVERKDIPMPTSADSDWTLDIGGEVLGCPRDDGTWEYGGELSFTYDYGAEDYPGAQSGVVDPEQFYVYDTVGGQPPESLSLVVSDWETRELHEEFMAGFNDNLLDITNALTQPTGDITLYDGFDDRIGTFEVTLIPADPQCPLAPAD